MPSARRVAWAKFRVAAVSVVAIIILMTLVVLLTGGTLLTKKATVYMYIPDATGLAYGSPVRVDGIAVGKVDTVELSGSEDPRRIVRVVMKVESERLASIPSDSTAKLTSETLIGDRYVDIDSGRSPAHLMPNGEVIYSEPTDFMKRLDLAQFEQQMRVVDAMLTDIEQGKNRVGQLLLGDQMYKDLTRQVGELHTALLDAVSVNTAVGQLLYSDEMYRSISEPVQQLDAALARIQSGQGSMGQFLRDTAQYEQARAAMQELRKSVEELRSSEWIKSDTSYEDLNRLVSSMVKSVEELNTSSMLNNTSSYESLIGVARELQHSLRDFREDPRKYLRLKVF